MSTTIFAEPIEIDPVASSKLPVSTSVSVVIPCYNEERFIGKALENLADQYTAADYEIIVVDGMSNDRTRDVVAEFQQSHPELSIRLLENPDRKIPHALNLGIKAARGEIVARIDAHAAPSLGYIRRCVDVLNDGRTAVVGMPCRVRPAADTTMARAIAIAVSHPFGIGDAKYRLGSEESRDKQEEVDTVAFACFRKSLWLELGGYDEKLLTNEDYDFNYRARLSGGRVVLDHFAHCDYFARATLTSLSAQYLRYGAWKARMIRQHPRSIKLRHLVAPLFVSSIFLLASIGFWRSFAWTMLAADLAVYLIAAIAFAYQAARENRGNLPVMLAMPLVFFTLHSSWGASFLLGLIRPPR